MPGTLGWSRGRDPLARFGAVLREARCDRVPRDVGLAARLRGRRRPNAKGLARRVRRVRRIRGTHRRSRRLDVLRLLDDGRQRTRHDDGSTSRYVYHPEMSRVRRPVSDE